MNRRHLLSAVHRAIARNASAPADAVDHATIAGMSIADLDRLGPRLVTTSPIERAVCIYCTVAPATDAHFPYCSSICAINAENS